MTDEHSFEDEEVTKHFFAVWCNNGFETLIDLTQEAEEYQKWQKDMVVRILEDNPLRPSFKGISFLPYMLRARYNSYRHYEMYAFSSTMTREELMEVIASTPQILVDWIRKFGIKISSSGGSNKDEIV